MSRFDRYKKKRKPLAQSNKSRLPQVGDSLKIGHLDGICVKRTATTATILCLDGEHVISEVFYERH
jgi:hypothetical protein